LATSKRGKFNFPISREDSSVPMSRLTELKTNLQEEAGYAYCLDRQLYMNRKTRKAFSIQFIQDHDEDQLRKSIREKTAGIEWWFYFNSPLSEAVKHELESIIG
jgi:hypothetical protein